MEFINRKAQYPGRIKLVKVAGSTDLYDMTLADGSVTGNYVAGTPLNAETFNTMLDEISTEIKNSMIKSIQLTDGTNNGTRLSIGSSRDLTIKLPTTIKAALSGNATTATTATAAGKVSTSYGNVTFKTVSLSTSYTTVYTASTYSTILLLLAPWSGSAKNTAVFAASYSDGKTSINDVNYVNKSGYINKRWSGKNFQIAMSSSGANGSYVVAILDAHY